jgi:hypothetical protein
MANRARDRSGHGARPRIPVMEILHEILGTRPTANPKKIDTSAAMPMENTVQYAESEPDEDQFEGSFII